MPIAEVLHAPSWETSGNYSSARIVVWARKYINRVGLFTAPGTAAVVETQRAMKSDKSGFWEQLGYNNHGDPFKEERYWGD